MLLKCLEVALTILICATQVFVTYEGVDPSGHRVTRFAKLSMIDLAGSERAAETNNRGIRMIEGANINKSLLALGNCINALIEPGKKNKYVNYRDSKLTRLLKDSLGGNCRTVMIANISPSSSSFDETMNTLKYAGRAATIKTKISQQVTFKYDETIQQLQSEIETLKPRTDIVRNIVPRTRPRQDKTAANNLDHEDGASSSHGHATHNNTSGTPKNAPGSPGNGDQGLFRELSHQLEMLFADQLEIRTQLLDADETDAESTIMVVQKQAEIDGLQKRLSSKDIDKSLKMQIETQIFKLQEAIDGLHKTEHSTTDSKRSLDKKMQEIDVKIKNVQQNIPKSVDKRTKQYLGLQIKTHYLEMDNLDLDLNNTLSTASIKQKQLELQHIYALLNKYELLISLQRDLLLEKKIAVPSKILKLYEEIGSNGKFDRKRVDEDEANDRSNIRLQSLNERIAVRTHISVPASGHHANGTTSNSRNTPMVSSGTADDSNNDKSAKAPEVSKWTSGFAKFLGRKTPNTNESESLTRDDSKHQNDQYLQPTILIDGSKSSMPQVFGKSNAHVSDPKTRRDTKSSDTKHGVITYANAGKSGSFDSFDDNSKANLALPNISSVSNSSKNGSYAAKAKANAYSKQKSQNGADDGAMGLPPINPNSDKTSIVTENGTKSNSDDQSYGLKNRASQSQRDRSNPFGIAGKAPTQRSGSNHSLPQHKTDKLKKSGSNSSFSNIPAKTEKAALLQQAYVGGSHKASANSKASSNANYSATSSDEPAYQQPKMPRIFPVLHTKGRKQTKAPSGEALSELGNAIGNLSNQI